MKKLSIGLCVFTILTCGTYLAIATPSPYNPAEEARFAAVESRATVLESTASGLTTLADGKIYVGNGSNVATEVTPSGDITMTNSGVTAIGAGKVLQTMLQVPTAEALLAHRVARATWDFAADGGTIGAINMGVALPAKASIIRSYFYVVTQITDAGSGTHAISCETANNIFSAADETGVASGTWVAGISDGAVANIKKITNACNLTFTIAGADATAGKVNVFVEYYVTD